jgi:hypothetical protein
MAQSSPARASPSRNLLAKQPPVHIPPQDIAKIQAAVDQLRVSFEERIRLVEARQSRLEDSVAAFAASAASIRTDLQVSQRAMDNSLTEIKLQLSTLITSGSTSSPQRLPSPSSHLPASGTAAYSLQWNESAERLRRATNIMVFEIEEQPSGEPEVSQAADHTAALAAVLARSGVTLALPTVVNVTRVGKFHPTKVRPLRLQLADCDLRESILQAYSTRRDRSVRPTISADRTPLQKEEQFQRWQSRNRPSAPHPVLSTTSIAQPTSAILDAHADVPSLLGPIPINPVFTSPSQSPPPVSV